DFPLTLAQAVAYISKSPLLTIKKYMENYQAKTRKLSLLSEAAPRLTGVIKEEDKKRAVYTSWYLSIEKLKAEADPVKQAINAR
ncbi:hypothetical protein OFN51_38125, partial [Escherichia coli]|nr:hypothetical protein [Escherichia coli]